MFDKALDNGMLISNSLIIPEIPNDMALEMFSFMVMKCHEISWVLHSTIGSSEFRTIQGGFDRYFKDSGRDSIKKYSEIKTPALDTVFTYDDIKLSPDGKPERSGVCTTEMATSKFDYHNECKAMLRVINQDT
ncbi:hypothetical protein ACHAPJ_013193 [Fusarium lateritium]